MTIPNTSGSFYHILISIGLAVMLFSGFNMYRIQDNYSQNFDKWQEKIEQYLATKDKLLEFDIPNFAKEIAARNGVKLEINDSMRITTYNRYIPSEVAAKDSIEMIFASQNDTLKKLNYQHDEYNRQLESINKKYEETDSFNLAILAGVGLIGLAIFGIGLAGLLLNQTRLDKLAYLNLLEKAKDTYHFCHSCGSQFNAIVKNGKEQDGTNNKAFCIKCYDMGRFTEPDLTSEDVVNRIIKDTKARRLQHKEIRESVLRLDRWKSNVYFRGRA